MSNKHEMDFVFSSHLNHITEKSLFSSGRLLNLPVSTANGEQNCAHA